VVGGEGLAVDRDGEQELEARGQVLEEADGGERQAPGSVGEEEERQGGDGARGDEQEVRARTLVTEGPRPGGVGAPQKQKYPGREQNNLDQEPDFGLGPHGLPLKVRASEDFEVETVGRFTPPKEVSAPWIIPRRPEQVALVQAAQRQSTRLVDLGYRVSTGPLVWNRHKEQRRA
jgi:hypothetical protein